MLSRYVRRLCLSKREISKCGAHRCSTISDATLVEVVGKRSKIQVRRASLHDLFCISNYTEVQGDVQRIASKDLQ